MAGAPPLPIPPEQYDRQYFIQLNRILAQYFREDTAEDDEHSSNINIQQVLQWLS